MTRANFKIITRDGTMQLQCNSSAYPSEMMKPLLNFAISSRSFNKGATDGFYEEPSSDDLATFISDAWLTIGSVGNASYFYEVDFVKRTVKVWGNAKYWVKAPKDWEAKGWQGIYANEITGNMGYHSWRKGKCIYQRAFKSLIETLEPITVIKTQLNYTELREAEQLDC